MKGLMELHADFHLTGTVMATRNLGLDFQLEYTFYPGTTRVLCRRGNMDYVGALIRVHEDTPGENSRQEGEDLLRRLVQEGSLTEEELQAVLVEADGLFEKAQACFGAKV